jgi:hypothetical protein
VSGVAIGAGQLFDRCNVERGEREAPAILEPNDNSVTARVDARMIGAGHVVTVTAARHDDKRLEWPRFKVMADIFDYRKTITGACLIRQERLMRSDDQTRRIPNVSGYAAKRSVKHRSYGSEICGF